MPVHPSQFHHLAMGNRKRCAERINSLERAVQDIMGVDCHVRMRSRATNVVGVYTGVPTDNQVDWQLNAMAVL